MSVFAIAALTADGLIAENHEQHVSWTSSEDKQFYRQTTKDAGVMIFGARTFSTVGRALPGRLTIVYTSHPKRVTAEGVETTAAAPADLIKQLHDRGYKDVAICGGSSIYRLFIEAGVVDDLYLTIEPLLFGQGVGLLDKPLERKLELVDNRLLNDSTILLHYRILK